jgi:hypothetical protein
MSLVAGCLQADLRWVCVEPVRAAVGLLSAIGAAVSLGDGGLEDFREPGPHTLPHAAVSTIAA